MSCRTSRGVIFFPSSVFCLYTGGGSGEFFCILASYRPKRCLKGGNLVYRRSFYSCFRRFSFVYVNSNQIAQCLLILFCFGSLI